MTIEADIEFIVDMSRGMTAKTWAFRWKTLPNCLNANVLIALIDCFVSNFYPCFTFLTVGHKFLLF